MATLGKTTITDLSVYNTIHGKIEQADKADKVTISTGSVDTWRNMLVTKGANDIFSVPDVYANYSLGALKAKTVYITGSASNTTALISSDDTKNMYFGLSGVIPLVIDTSSTINPIIRPSISLKDAVDLGSTQVKWRNVYAKNFVGDVTGNVTGNVTGTADIAKTLPYFNISSNGQLPSDGSPEYVKFATITIPTTAWVRRSATLFFQDYEASGYQGDILTIQAFSDGSGVGSTPSVKWVTKYQKSTIGNIIISKISDNVYDLYLEATTLTYITLRIFYLTTCSVGPDKDFNFISNASWSTTAPVITSRSSLKNVASELGSARTLWGQSFDGTANVSGDMTGVGSIAMSKALTITGTNESTANLHFGRASYNYISGPSGSTIHMCPGGISKSSTTGYIFSSTAFYPGTTNAYSIGTNTKQWNNIYGKTLYENGTSLVDKYAAKSHNHSASQITSGTLSVSIGGTGLSTITAGHVIIGNGTGTPTTAKIAELSDDEIDAIFTDLGVTF